MIFDTSCHICQGPQSAGKPLIRQSKLRETFSFNFGSYLKIKFDTYAFVDNQMVGPENEVTQYEPPNEGSKNVGGSDLYDSPSPFILRAIKGNEHLAPRTQITFPNNHHMIIGN
jgi:hypothetical protein